MLLIKELAAKLNNNMENLKEEKDEIIKDYTQEKLLAYDKIVQVVRETQSRIEGLDKRWRAIIEKEKETAKVSELREKIKEDVKEAEKEVKK